MRGARELYLNVLRGEFERRRLRNRAYSLRSFARDLGMAPSTLCSVLGGKKGLSRSSAGAIAERLRLPGAERDRFCDSVDAAHGRHESVRLAAAVKLGAQALSAEARLLDESRLGVVSRWVHFALLELLAVEPEADAETLGARLGLPGSDIVAALARLEAVGLVEVHGTRHRPCDSHTFTSVDVPSRAIRDFHAGLLLRAVDALEEQSVGEREITSVIMAVAREDLPLAKSLLREFKAFFQARMATGRHPDAVYALSLQFFDLTAAPAGAGPGDTDAKTRD